MSRRFFGALLSAFVMLAAPGVAHVRIVGAVSVAGGTRHDVVFRCPTERDSPTVGLSIQLPPGIAPDSVRVPEMAGWHITKVGDVVSWDGGTIPPQAAETFTIDVLLPRGPRDLPFKAVQTYADGTIVRWIELADSDEPRPPNPAPVLHVR